MRAAQFGALRQLFVGNQLAESEALGPPPGSAPGGEPTFAEAIANEEVAPFPDLPAPAPQRQNSVESECDAGGFRSTLSVAAPLVWRCPISFTSLNDFRQIALAEI